MEISKNTKYLLFILALLVFISLLALDLYFIIKRNKELGRGKGWKCNPSSGKCEKNGHLGEEGVFGNKSECEENCLGKGWKCNNPSSGKCEIKGHLGEEGVFGNKSECEENCFLRGWKCNFGKCENNGRLGEKGVFGNKLDCINNCLL